VARRSGWADAGLMNEGLRLFEELPRSASSRVLLATDLHAGNVLAAERLWTFARAAVMSGSSPARRWASELARVLAR